MIKNKDGSFTVELDDSINTDKNCRICNESLYNVDKSFKCQTDNDGETVGVHTKCLENEE